MTLVALQHVQRSGCRWARYSRVSSGVGRGGAEDGEGVVAPYDLRGAWDVKVIERERHNYSNARASFAPKWRKKTCWTRHPFFHNGFKGKKKMGALPSDRQPAERPTDHLGLARPISRDGETFQPHPNRSMRIFLSPPTLESLINFCNRFLQN